MIKGIGTDLIELIRIKRLMKKGNNLADRILTPAERMVYDSHVSFQRKAEYLGGRFAAKEAFAKAAGQGIGDAFGFKDIEVLNNKDGAPNLSVEQLPSTASLFISLTHTQSYASAFVIIEDKKSW